jgi:hypothetical protein
VGSRDWFDAQSIDNLGCRRQGRDNAHICL